jgi:acetolactate synthase-1/2/3 large subunit
VLTGAEAVARVLAERGVETIFAYPGTSELALCDAVYAAPGLRLVHGRGDRECAFMAAGASLLRPNRAAALVHGARGLTNATGAVAAARRNEVGTLFLVGLPSTTSARFLPPHGEEDLVPSIGRFTRWSWEAPAVPEPGPDRVRAAHELVARLREALVASARPPTRPSLFGIPQDVAEARWIPPAALEAGPPSPEARPPVPGAALAALAAASRPLFLVDDYALRCPGLRPALARLTDLLGAPVFQLRYRRGPMLFERLRRADVPGFLGWFNPFSPAHDELLDRCDLFVTVEDRNAYRRVFGRPPACRKLAISGDGEKALKNGYLGAGDLLLIGDVTGSLRSLAGALERRQVRRRPWFDDPGPAAALAAPERASEAVERLRAGLAGALARTLAGWEAPVLVDDSQMFGGLVAEHYDLLPPGLRVFGDHCGFVGGGLPTATGLAIAEPGRRVLCTLGDQGFVNSVQALVSAVQERARIVVLVCNNGESVSLQKQAAAGDGRPGAALRPYLRNTPGLSYRRVAEAFGVRTWLVDVRSHLEAGTAGAAAVELERALGAAGAVPGPALVELRLPGDPELWRGIWLTHGFEQAPAAARPPAAVAPSPGG